MRDSIREGRRERTGSHPQASRARWRRDGREIFYVSTDLRMMVVPVQITPEVKLGTPTTLFAIANKHWVVFDVSPDGTRFLVITPEVVASEQPLTAIDNIVPKGAGSTIPK